MSLLVLCLFLLYRLLNMFRATLCPSSGGINIINIILKVTSSWSLYPHWTTMHGQPCIKIKWVRFNTYPVFYNKCKFHEPHWPSHVFISVTNQIDAQNFCFTICLFHVSTCFEHMCSSSGCQNCITQPDDEHMCSKHVEAWNKLIVKQKFCASRWLITETN